MKCDFDAKDCGDLFSARSTADKHKSGVIASVRDYMAGKKRQRANKRRRKVSAGTAELV